MEQFLEECLAPSKHCCYVLVIPDTGALSGFSTGRPKIKVSRIWGRGKILGPLGPKTTKLGVQNEGSWGWGIKKLQFTSLRRTRDWRSEISSPGKLESLGHWGNNEGLRSYALQGGKGTGPGSWEESGD